MMIFSGNTITEYGVTPKGQFFELHKIGRSCLQRITTDPERFLRWMIQSEVDRDLEDKKREALIKMLKVYWGLTYGDNIRGSFNEELYKKIIKAKRENGTLYR